MDSQDPRKINLSGHENHGVHVCHKCGWPFPNPHPSAKHRRAHKRICGTIEGYKLTDSEENPHLTVSDDEHLSDDDHKTPSPKIVKRSNNEGGVGERSNRSEDDVFSDAVTDFLDAGPRPVVEELLVDARELVSNVGKIIENDPVTTQSVKDGAITEIIQPPNNSTDSSQMQNNEAPESMSNPLGTAPLPHDHVPSSTISSMANSILDSGTEESVVVLSDKNGLQCDLFPTKPITSTDSPQENKKTNAGEDVTECFASSIGMESDTKENEVNNLEEKLLDIAVSPSENARETSETGSRLDEMNGNTSDPTADGSVQSNEDKVDVLGPKLPPSNLGPEVESVVHVETFVNTAQVQVDTAEGLDFASSGHIIEGCNTNGEGNENVHVLSVPGDLIVVDHPEIMVEDFKDHKALKMSLPVTLDSCETIRDKKDVRDPVSEENCSGIQSRQLTDGIGVSSSDMHTLEDKVNQEGGSRELTVEEVPVVEGEACEVKGTINIQSRQLTDGIGVSSSDMRALEDKVNQEGGSSELTVEEVPVNVEQETCEVKGTVSENHLSDELGAPADAARIEIEKSQTVCSPEEHEPQDFCTDLSKKILPENATMVVSNVDPKVSPINAEVNQMTNIVDGDDAGDDEKARTEKCDIAGNDCREGAAEENHAESKKTIPESGNNLCESQINQTMNLLAGDGVDDHESDKIKIFDIAGNGSMDGSTEEIPNTKTTPVSAGSPSEFHVVEDRIDRSLSNLPETESTDLVGVSDSSRVGTGTRTYLKNCQDEDSQKGVEELDINSSKQVPVVCVDAVGTVSESNHGSDVQLLQKTSEDQTVEDPLLSPVDAKSSVQSSVTVEDEHSKVLGRGASGIGSESLQGEGDNYLNKQQLGALAVDVLIDSSSQTDSLDGNWGSVSVLSAQSDAPAIVDAEALPSTYSRELAKAEKVVLKESKDASEGNSDRSDIFEPPSFLTLVEPSGGVDQEAAPSEIQTVEKAQQKNSASLQAGWFPSLTHVVNDSQGRKKNEEIIAKVTNWSTGKQQHTPLKSLLGEANAETKPKSPNPKENPNPVVQKDGTTTKNNNGSLVTTVKSVPGPEAPIAQAAKGEKVQEWNSPARYPANIKREKRKGKGKPYWIQFVCCSSIN